MNDEIDFEMPVLRQGIGTKCTDQELKNKKNKQLSTHIKEYRMSSHRMVQGQLDRQAA